LCDRLAGGGRLLNHCVVSPELSGGIAAMQDARERYAPAGWKVYTLGAAGSPGWYLDDEAIGVPFLEQVRASGVRRVCAHKGISNLVPTGSPRDVGPAAAAFPDLDFLIYHSGYEIPTGEAAEEGPYSDATAHLGTNRLVKSLREAGIAPGANVCAELGSTWFCLIRRPDEAAHVLGKLLLAVGEDNVLWGTDAIWYGPAQPAIDAFRAFQIPADLRDRCEPLNPIDLQVRLFITKDFHELQKIGGAGHRMALKELLTTNAVRRTNDRAWPALDVADKPGAYQFMIARKILLGDGFTIPGMRP